MAVDGFVLEEDDVSHLGNRSLILPCNREPPPSVFLLPEGVIEVEDDPPPGDLMLDGDVWIDFVPVTLPETEENVVGGEGNSQGSC